MSPTRPSRVRHPSLRKPKTSYRTRTRYRRLSEAAWEGIAFVERGKILDANQQLAELLGYSPHDIVGKPFTQLIAAGSRQAFLANISSGGEAGLELRALKKDGSTFPVEIRSHPGSLEKGHAMVLVIRDITARKGTEELLRENEESYRELAEGITEVFFAMDRGFTVTYWNKASEYLTGISARDAIGESLFDLLPPLRETGAADVFQKALGSRDPQSLVAEITFAEEPLVAEIRVYPTRRGLSVFVEDITEQKRAEQALRESEERFRNIYEESPIGIQLVDADGAVVQANRAVREILGVQRAEELRKHSFLNDPNLLPERKLDLKAGKTVRFETAIDFGVLREVIPTDRSGTATVDVQVTPLGAREQPAPRGYLIQVQDTTDRKRAEAQIKASLLEKEALLKEIHHRVKNNLQIVSSLLSLQSEYITNEKALEALRESQNRVRSMAMIHRQLYSSGDLARIDFARYVRDLADQIFRTYSLQASTIRLDLHIDKIPLGIDMAIPCGIIVNELVSNSLKHAFTGRQSGKISIGLHLTPGETLQLTVADDGIGIPKDLDVAESPSLGLKLVRTLAEQLKGSVSMSHDQGTQFVVRFPVA